MAQAEAAIKVTKVRATLVRRWSLPCLGDQWSRAALNKRPPGYAQPHAIPAESGDRQHERKGERHRTDPRELIRCKMQPHSIAAQPARQQQARVGLHDLIVSGQGSHLAPKFVGKASRFVNQCTRESTTRR